MYRDSCSLVYTQIPVYANETVHLDEYGTKPVSVKVNVPLDATKCSYCYRCSSAEPRDHEFLYEGTDEDSSCKYSVSYSGLCDSSLSEILVCKLDYSHRRETIKISDHVGYINSLVDVSDASNKTLEVNIADKSDPWTLDKIKKDITFCADIDDKDTAKIYDMLNNCKGVMSAGDNDIGFAAVTSHKIELYDTTPIHIKPRQFPEPVSRDIENECKKLLDLGVIEHSKSPWNFPVCPVYKRNGNLRLCIDYRSLNKVTKADRYPMPNLRESVFSLHNRKFFTSLDLTSGFHQIPLEESSREYTAFSVKRGHYQFKRLSFGLKNCPSAFQREIQSVLQKFDEDVLIYIDDILIMSHTLEDHINLVERVLNTLETSGIKINVKKCQFFQDKVDFLGHSIGRNGIAKSAKYLDVVRNFPRPQTISELRSFLGLINFQRKFVSDCSQIVKPLSRLTGADGNSQLNWSTEMDNAFDHLKLEMLKEIELSFPEYSPTVNKLELYVDASAHGAGATLSQLQNGVRKIILYSSMTFSKAQQNYSTIERELAGLRWAVKNLRSFLYGIDFIIFTDHRPLIYLNNAALVNSRLARTLDDLIDFRFEIRYIPGKENSAADYLSRMKALDETDHVAVDSNLLPDGLEVITKIDGGGNSLFESLLVCLTNHQKYRNAQLKVPSSALEIRKLLIGKLIESPNKYGLQRSKHLIRSLKCMLNPGQLPMTEVLLAFHDVFGIAVFVHCGSLEPIIFCTKDLSYTTERIHLQCLANIHYNPVQESLSYTPNIDTSRNIDVNISDCLIASDDFPGNSLYQTEPDSTLFQAHAMFDFPAGVGDELALRAGDEIDLVDCSNPSWWKGSTKDGCGYFPSNYVMVADTGKVDCTKLNHFSCSHTHSSISAVPVYCHGKLFCGILDSGAQISLITEDSLNKLDNLLSPKVEYLELDLSGVGKESTPVVGVVSLSIAIAGFVQPVDHTFCVVKSNAMQYCFLLGNNFLKQFGITLNFDELSYCFNDSSKYKLGEFSLNNSKNDVHNVGLVSVENKINCSALNDKIIDLDTVKLIQKRDFALKQLRRKILDNEPTKYWRHSCLRPFIPHAKSLRVYLDTLYYDKDNVSIPVVSFKLLVECTESFHTNNAHVGIQKLKDLVSAHLWHPALASVVHDVCVTCEYCQVAKVSNQLVTPPVRKITSGGAFDLLVVDLLEFPKTVSGFICCLVAIDHHSKWLSVVPLRNKRGATVASACERILVSLPKCPNKILSDNGPEFRSKEFNDLLMSYHAKHILSTPYHPQSCGEVERVNRTITSLLKSLTTKANAWDQYLARAVFIYNNTKHSTIKMSPSELILSQSHDLNHSPLVPVDLNSNWIEGNPKFLPFKLGQKVVRKIPVQGHLTTHKFALVYDGPYIITSVQPNEVSYVITRISDSVELRVHYTQLKPWIEAPPYLQRHRALYKNDKGQAGLANEVIGKQSLSIIPMYHSSSNNLSNIVCLESSDFDSHSESSFSGFDSDVSSESEQKAKIKLSQKVIPAKVVRGSQTSLTENVKVTSDTSDDNHSNIDASVDRIVLALLEDNEDVLTVVERSMEAQSNLIRVLSTSLDAVPINSNESTLNQANISQNVSTGESHNDNSSTEGITQTSHTHDSVVNGDDNVNIDLCSRDNDKNSHVVINDEPFSNEIVNNEGEQSIDETMSDSIIISPPGSGIHVTQSNASSMPPTASTPCHDNLSFIGFHSNMIIPNPLLNSSLLEPRRRSLSPIRATLAEARR